MNRVLSLRDISVRSSSDRNLRATFSDLMHAVFHLIPYSENVMKFAKAERVLSAIGLPPARTLLAMSGVAAAMLFAPVAAQAGPGPDVKIDKSCSLDPSKGPTVVVCVINVANIGTTASVSPITITDTPTGPSGTSFLTQPGSSFPCAPSSGSALPASFTCSAPFSLNPGGPMAGSSSGSTFLTFTLPQQGGTFTNCAKVTSGQNPTTPGDQNLSNNGPSCSTVVVKGSGGGGGTPDLAVFKECKKHNANAITCSIKVTNNGPGPSPTPLYLTDTISPIPPGTSYTGASGNVSCSGGGALVAPVNCTVNQPIPAGQSITVLLSFTFKSKGAFAQCAKITQKSAKPEKDQKNNEYCLKMSMP